MLQLIMQYPAPQLDWNWQSTFLAVHALIPCDFEPLLKGETKMKVRRFSRDEKLLIIWDNKCAGAPNEICSCDLKIDFQRWRGVLLVMEIILKK